MLEAIRGRVVLADTLVDDGTVIVEGSTIVWAGPTTEAPATKGARRAAWVLPGLVDRHNHGGAGATNLGPR